MNNIHKIAFVLSVPSAYFISFSVIFRGASSFQGREEQVKDYDNVDAVQVVLV